MGSGAGDVSILAARLVGREGEVVGVERDPQAVTSATARVAQAEISNVRFIEGDAQTLDSVPDGFDAAVGRLCLMYLPDPIAALRRTAGLVRPGGLICFHEGDMAYDWAAPMTPLWAQMRQWFLGCPRTGKRCYPDRLVVVRPWGEMNLRRKSCFDCFANKNLDQLQDRANDLPEFT